MLKRETKPIWTTSTFLVYTGGLTVLGGALSALGYLSETYGDGWKSAAWALLILVILYGFAHALWMRDRPIAAGIFAFASVIAWGYFVARVFIWWGWNGFQPISDVPLSGWSWSRLALELLILIAAWHDRRQFRFPFIRLISAVVFYAFVVDLITNGGNWTTWVTLILGFMYFLAGTVVDQPSGFWLHLVGGALIGGSLLQWFHTTDGDFAAISAFAVIFVMVAYATERSSWAVYGTIGFFAATVHYLIGSPSGILGNVLGGSSPFSGWSPGLAFGLLGLWLVALGLLGRRKKGQKHAAVVVTAPPPSVA